MGYVLYTIRGYVLYTRTETLVLVIYCMRPWSWSWLYYICTLEWHMSTKQSIHVSIVAVNNDLLVSHKALVLVLAYSLRLTTNP